MSGLDVERRRRRGHWSGAEFIFTAVSTSVGLASFSTFPHYCLKYGAVFFVPAYLIQLALVGAPCLCLEMFIGQFGGVGTISVFGRAIPLSKGVGIGMLLVQMLFMSFYSVKVAWLGYYLVSPLLLHQSLPWAFCHQPWTTGQCHPVQNTTITGDTVAAYPEHQFLVRHVWRTSIPQHFSLEELGLPLPHMAIALAGVWGVAFLCLICGIKVFGKVSYLCVVVPLGLTISLLVRALTLPGALDGILHYLGPVTDKYQSEWNREQKYKNPIEQAKMWHDATLQVVLSLGLGHGVYISLASHNKFLTRIYRSSFIVMLCQFLASLAFTALVASLLGFLSVQTGISVPTLAHSTGADFRFLVITLLQSFLAMPLSSLWSALYLCLLISLTLGCLLPYTLSIISSLRDELQCCLSSHKSTQYTCCTTALLTALIITLLYLTGMIYTTQSGIMFVHIIEDQLLRWPVYILLFFFLIAFAWFFPVKRVYSDVRLMIGRWDRCYLLAVCWAFITPAIVLLLLAWYVYDEWIVAQATALSPISSHYPWWTVCVGWTAAILPISFIPLWMIFKTCHVCAVHGRCSKLCSSTESWRTVRSENLPAYSPLLTQAQVQTRETRATQTSDKPKRKQRGNGEGKGRGGGAADYEPAVAADLPPGYHDDLEDGWMVGGHRNYPVSGGYPGHGPSAPPMEGTYQYRPIYPALTLGESRF